MSLKNNVAIFLTNFNKLTLRFVAKKAIDKVVRKVVITQLHVTVCAAVVARPTEYRFCVR